MMPTQMMPTSTNATSRNSDQNNSVSCGTTGGWPESACATVDAEKKENAPETATTAGARRHRGRPGPPGQNTASLFPAMCLFLTSGSQVLRQFRLAGSQNFLVQ